MVSAPAYAQQPQDQVHITPPAKPEPPPQPDIDPSLKTHTPPMKVDVDL
ncbi:MAG: VWA domain-containing protein, partial [Acidobacteria bacterium]